ncbi:FAD-dependent oxidoreductase [Nocardioides pacificus]
MDRTRLVVIGADAAGMSAAHQALRTARARGRELEVVALERGHDTSYSACGIPYWVAGDVAARADLVARTPQQHREAGIDLRTGVSVHGLDLDSRTVACRGADGESILGFDELMIATGARPVLPAWASDDSGTPYGGVGPVKDLDDGQLWLDRMAHDHAPGAGSSRGSVVVAGAGYIGVEMAEAALRRGFDVTVLTRSTVMSSLDADMGERIAERLRAAGAKVVESDAVEGVHVGEDGWVREAETVDGRCFPCDLLVIAFGVAPATGFAVTAGLSVGAAGGLLPDATGAVADGVWSAGDCCEQVHRLTGERTYLPLGTHANKQGRVAGANIGGAHAEFGGVLGTAITRFVHGDEHVEISRTGLSSTEARSAGIEARSLVTDGSTTSGYMPEAASIAVKVLAEPGTRRLLGAQIVGGPGAGKRIDSVAAALWGAMSVDDLAWMDLSYAPPFATAWEIVQVAARRLAERL